MTPDRHPQADEAALYVLGQLPPNARHQFEIQLTQSAELRALVQELEAGVEATARAVPQRPPPPQTWTAIEKAIAQEVERKVITPPFWTQWWRSGWAAAAACLLALIGYAWWSPQNQKPLATASPPVAEESPAAISGIETMPARPVANRANIAASTNLTVIATATLPTSPTAEPANPELASLRWQITALRTQLEELAQVVARQKELLAEPGRFKFFPLADSHPPETEATPATPMSPGLQRAMFYAMARDMGWVSRTSASEAQNNNSAASATTVTTAWGVDFVDIGKSTAAATTAATGSTEAQKPPNSPAISIRPSGNNIPGYLGENGTFVMALDSTIAPRDSQVFIMNGTSVEGYHLIGSALLRDNPMVISFSSDALANGDVLVTATPAGGASNFIGSFQVFRHAYPALR